MKYSIGLPGKVHPLPELPKDYYPCAGGLSALNAIGTCLRGPINSGLTRWRLRHYRKREAGEDAVGKYQIQPE